MSTRPAAPVPAPMHFVGRPSSLLRNLLQWVLLWPCIAWFCYPFVVRGRDRIPSGPVVFVANHGSHADTAVVLRALPGRIRRRTVVAAAEDHFWRNPTVGAFVSLLTGAFPFPRSGCEGIHRAERLLARGYNVLLFPEGTRSNGGRVGEFHKGAAILAEGGATIIPIGLYGSAEVLPKGKVRPRRHAVGIVFGSPISPERFDGTAALRRRVAEAAGRACNEIERIRPTFYDRIRSFARSPLAVTTTMVWAFAEALAWPVVPDFILFPLVLAVPARMLPLLGAAAAGSVAGGLAAYLLGPTGLGTGLLGVAPLVTEPMVAEAGRELGTRGALGLLAQPLSGIPYKVFALQAADAGVPLFAYVAVSALARAGRFLAVAVIAAVLGRLARPLWERTLPLFLVLYATAFAVGLARVVASWGSG